MNAADLNLSAALPALSLALGACVLFLLDAFIPKESKAITVWLAVIGIVVSFVLSLGGFSVHTTAFSGMFIADPFTAMVNIITLIAALLGIMVAYSYLKRTGIERGEYYPLLLITASGAMFMASAGDLVVIFVGLELLSIPLYILAGFRRPEPRSEESAMKYFLLGAFSTGFLVYGIALIYGATGTTNLQAIYNQVTGQHILSPFLLLTGAGLVLVALGFKVAAVPFHMWTPDVYQGAPTPVTAYMSVVAKVGGFGALLRLLIYAIPALVLAQDPHATTIHAAWQDTVSIIAALTMILGNFVAITQKDIKRLLAYSSIAHAGYILMAVAAAGTFTISASTSGQQTISLDFAQGALQGVLIYLLAYAFTNIGAFAVAIAVERDDASGTLIDDFAGLGSRQPWLAGALTIFLLSLTGIPLTAGFTGKWFVFLPTLNSGLWGLALIGVLTSLVSAYYYLRPVVKIWLESGTAEGKMSPSLSASVALCAIGTVALGVLPFLATQVAQNVTIAMK
ncbi:MAG TPA: NADH-quinone oxidoreductase subunit N [Aggregatilineales bacterium]|nr:NADH-quinone oxidoreductase subunit N [Aggregatilineales bacterium]